MPHMDSRIYSVILLQAGNEKIASDRANVEPRDFA